MSADEALRYPVGKFQAPALVTAVQRAEFTKEIESAPARLRAAVTGLTDDQLDTPYREGGWTLRQVVHHVADSHINAYVRFKLTLTEQEPTIKTYDEARWAEVEEARTGPIEMSLVLLEVLHRRWVASLRLQPPDAFSRMFRHPERGLMSIDALLGLYAWHGRHHAAHITGLRARKGW
jgi:uncharacterized damage-inducible protein DinB